ncbi:transglutaminase-like domain-containing protein [Alteromonas sp. 1_MG-2023]|uniref:transglutaminase-like domain-containing protein n=1 Tax=Alteromonas sp. 1_MG-2023 TaxID=3062669 RepID=UPI0026E35D76|nr:transglutaminase-like domain-containing protein [Alteromonas sp. 1_MG-2023]MDO6566369.1 transglutaminase-like domain-containing protein [Alteromonas sp. 1_MG-2023]
MRFLSRFFVGLSLTIASAFTLTVNAQSVPSMAEIGIELAKGQALPLSKQINFELVSSNAIKLAANLANWQGVTAEQVGDNRLSITLSPMPRFTKPVIERHSADSFVIDLSEASTKAFVASYQQEYAQAPFALENLKAFVDGYITYPSYIHGFNIASVVASQRSGDCTEYAVLTAALARSLGMSAKVIIGTVIVEQDDNVNAFGHAWTEIWHNDQWHIVDSALYRLEATQHFYLPGSELDNEGPGYGMGLINALVFMPEQLHSLRSMP